MKFSTYIWMFINYEAYQGGYYFSFSLFMHNIVILKIWNQMIYFWI